MPIPIWSEGEFRSPVGIGFSSIPDCLSRSVVDDARRGALEGPGECPPFLRVRGSGANSRKRLRWLKRTRRPFDAATVRDLARLTDLECEKCPQKHASDFVVGRPVRREGDYASGGNLGNLGHLGDHDGHVVATPVSDVPSSIKLSTIAATSPPPAMALAISSPDNSLNSPSLQTTIRSPSSTARVARSISTSGPTPSALVRTP